MIVERTCDYCGEALVLREVCFVCEFCGKRYSFEEVGYVPEVQQPEEQPEAPSRSPEEVINELYEQAMEYHEKGKYERELKLLNEALALDGNNALTYMMLGSCYNSMGNNGKAIEMLNRSISLNPNDAYAHVTNGAVCLEMRNFRDAAAGYERGLSLLSPSSEVYWSAYARHAIAIGKLGDAGRADKMLAEAEKHGEDIASLRQFYDLPEKKEPTVEEYLEQADYLDADGKYEEELNVLAEALKLDRRNMSVLTRLANCYYTLEDNDKAATIYKKMVEIDPQNGAAYAGLGIVLTDLNDYSGAIAAFEKGLPMENIGEALFWTAYANYAVCIGRLGDLERADRMLSEAEQAGFDMVDTYRVCAGLPSRG